MKISSTVFNKFQREITPKLYRQELQFLWSAPHLKILDLSMKFHENILNSFQVIEGTQNYHCQIQRGITPKMY